MQWLPQSPQSEETHQTNDTNATIAAAAAAAVGVPAAVERQQKGLFFPFLKSSTFPNPKP